MRGEQTRHTDQPGRSGARAVHRRSEEHDFSRKALADGAMALASHTLADVRSDCERLRHDLKNPSTLRDAESPQLQLIQWVRGRPTKCATLKCSLKNPTSILPQPQPCNLFQSNRTPVYSLY